MQAQQFPNPSTPNTAQHDGPDSSPKTPIGIPQSSQSPAPLNDAETLTQRGDFQKAEHSARTYLSSHPDSADGHFLLGYILYRIDKPKESLAEYTLGARSRRPSANDLAVVAIDYALLRDYVDADKWLTQVTTLDPSNGLYWYYLGRTKYNENRFTEAIRAFKSSLKLRPRYIRAEYNLGLCYAGEALNDKAKAAYETALSWQKGSPHEDPQPYLDLGILLADEGHADQALPYLQKAVEIDANNPKMHEELGRIYEQLHDLGNAQLQLASAVSLAPNVPSLHFELGRIYRKKGLDRLARIEFARCAILNGTLSTDSAETPNTDIHK